MSESNWISVHERLPLETKRYLIAVRRDVTEAVFHLGKRYWETCAGGIRVNAEYWRDLPDPPPRKSSFETWWQEDICRAIGQTGLATPALKEWCKQSWDAAEKAVLGPDYVP